MNNTSDILNNLLIEHKSFLLLMSDIAGHAIDGNALLFVGSGFSLGAKSVNDENFPTGKVLAKSLYEKAGGKTDVDDLAKASSAFWL